MKKIFLTLSSIFIFLVTTPIFAQEDPGDDPDAPSAPIDHYVWFLIALGLIYVFFKLRTSALLKRNMTNE